MDSFDAPPATSGGGLAGEALSAPASNGGTDAPGREVLVGEIVTSEPTGPRTSNGAGETSGEGPDTLRP